MTNAQTDYTTLMDQLLDLMTDLETFDLPGIYAVMTDLCKLLRVSRGVTSFFRSPDHEKAGKGESFTCYDSGEPSHLVFKERTMLPTMMVGTCEVYIAEGEQPWTEEEAVRIKRIQRMMLTILSKHRLNEEVERLTFYDGDGYKNVRYFLKYVGQMAAAGRLSGKAAARFNLKHFSMLNQQLGRASCNILMRNFIGHLGTAIGETGFVCRLGGDNFVLICDASLVHEIIGVFRGVPVVYNMNTKARATVSARAGFFVIPEGYDEKGPDDIMNKITTSFETAKNGGGKEIVFCSSELISEKEAVLHIQQLFPEALANEEFLVYYQPKIDVYHNELTGAEALCRWWHDGKIVPPMDFIPILERSLDICRLDFYMLEHVCQDIRRWLDEGKKVVRVSVNLSRKHMVDADLFEHIVEIIDRYNVPHEYIEIELTETTTDVEFRDLKRMVNGLQSEGITASVDDFGMGYSSLNLLRDIPWNVLKVDKTFLPGDEGDGYHKNSVLFKYVIAMARELGLECIAEGVETEEQIKALKDNFCNVAQGFYFDRPLPVADFENRLDKHIY